MIELFTVSKSWGKTQQRRKASSNDVSSDPTCSVSVSAMLHNSPRLSLGCPVLGMFTQFAEPFQSGRNIEKLGLEIDELVDAWHADGFGEAQSRAGPRLELPLPATKTWNCCCGTRLRFHAGHASCELIALVPCTSQALHLVISRGTV